MPSSNQNSSAQTIDRAADAVHGTVDRLSDGAKNVDERMRNQAHQIASKAGSVAADARSHSEKLINDVSGYVKTNPMTSVGVALAAGVLIHKIFSRQ